MDYFKLIRPFVFIVLFATELLAQNHAMHHSKYWFYRYRMRNEFMARVYGAPVCGTPSGFMIPASAAYQATDKDLNFGDGTSMVGNYLSVLTTEYDLLQKGNNNYTQGQLNDVLQEIYWALKAYERLDKNAEVLFPPKKWSCSESINGFFVRDDVDKDELPKNMVMRPPSVWKDAKIPERKKIGESDYSRGHNVNIDDLTVDDSGDDSSDELGVFPSADQITNLLVGFAFVKKKLNGVAWNGEDLGVLADKYTYNIVDYTRKLGYDMRVPNDDRHTAYAAYFNFGRFGYGMAKAGDRIFNSIWGSQTFNSGTFDNGLEYKHTAFWNCLNYPSGKLEYERNYTNSAYNNAIYSQLAAVGSSWQYGLTSELCREWVLPMFCFGFKQNCTNICPWFDWDCGLELCVTYPAIWTGCSYTLKFWNYKVDAPGCAEVRLGLCISPFELPRLSYNTTAMALSEYGHQTNTQIFAMMHKYLHDQGDYTYGVSRIWEYLASAPCGGPHKYPYNDPHNSTDSYGAYGWHVDNRWEKSNPQSYENDSHHEGWNGLDYMLLHNLYYLNHGNLNDMQSFRNEMDYFMNNQFWPNAQNQGSKSTAKKINGFETIYACSTLVNSTADLTLQAGKNIKLSSGFNVKDGANFKAFTKYTFNYCDLSIPFVPNGTRDNFRLGGGTYEEDVIAVSNGVSEPINDSARVMSIITREFNKKVDSARVILENIKQQNRYVPLSEFVAMPTSELNIPPSQIISLTPNPSSGTFIVTFFLAKPEVVGFYLVSPVGLKTSLAAEAAYVKGKNVLTLNSNVVPNNYTVLMQGVNVTSSKNIIIQ